MKALVTVLVLSTLIIAGSSCAKHDWEETKVLHEGMNKDAHGHGGHDSHGAAEAHEAHGEVHTENKGEAAHAPAEKKH